MAVVEFSLKDLDKLAGKKLTKEHLEKIPMMGCPLEKLEKDKVLYEVFPNRPDMLSTEGFTRAARTFLGFSKGLVSYKALPSGIRLHVEKSVSNVRPHIAAAVVRNVRLTHDVIASLVQVQEKIHDTMGRKRKKVAVGLHDLDKVKQPFRYKAVMPDEIKFIPLGKKEKMTLGEIEKKHEKGGYVSILKRAKRWPVIVDKNNDVLSFPPVINGELTRVTEKTKNLFIDITGSHEGAVNYALNIIVTSLAERGFKIETVSINKKKTPNLNPRRILVNLDYVNKLLDLDLSKAEFIETIARMGFGFDGKYVLVPCYRADIMHEIDVVEDVAIAHGYEKFEPRVPKVPTIAQRYDMEEFSEFASNLMKGMGFQEAVSMILTNEIDEFEKMLIKKEDACETLNPVSVECTICRKNLLPSLMDVLAQNLHREYPQKIFEIGYTVVPDKESETGSMDMLKLAAVISNSKVSYEDISSVLDALLNQLGLSYKFNPLKHPSFIEGRAAEIKIGNEQFGTIGEIHPQVLNNWKLEKPVVAFELDLQKVFYLKK